MHARPLTRSDIDAGPSWSAEIAPRPDQWRDAHTRAIVLLDDGTPAAVGMLWRSRVHHSRYWVDVVVDPARRRRGLGSRAVAALAALRPHPLPLQTRGFVGDERLAFADALGARTYQVVPPWETRTADRTALRPALASTHDAATVDLPTLGRAFASMYDWTHAAWAPVAPDFATALLEDFADEVDLDASSVTLDPTGAVTALALVFSDAVPPVLVAETTSRDTPDGERLVSSCVRRSVDVLAARGIDRVDLDGHVSDPHFLPAWIRLAPTGRWFRLVEVLSPPSS